MNFFGKHNILSSSRYGFQKKSTSHAILKISEYIYQQLNNGKKCIGVFLHLAKLFDTVDNNNLTQIGINGKALDIIFPVNPTTGDNNSEYTTHAYRDPNLLDGKLY